MVPETGPYSRGRTGASKRAFQKRRERYHPTPSSDNGLQLDGENLQLDGEDLILVEE